MADQLVSLLSDLVAIDSVNTFADPTGGGEGAIADYVAEHCRRLGLAVEKRDVFPHRPNVWAHLEAPGARGRLLLNAHLDTVPAGDMPTPFAPRVENGRLYGRGSCDDKGPLAAMLIAMERLLARRGELRASVTLVATMDEESRGTGVRALAASPERFDGGVVAEGTDLCPVLAVQGGALVRVRVRGRSAHSSRPELGVNALVHMAEVIRFIDEEYAPRLNQRRHALIGSPTLAMTRLESGVAVNIIPPEAVLTINRRAIPGETLASLGQDFEAALDELRARRPDLSIAPIELDLWEDGLDTPPDAPVAQAALAAVRAVLGRGEFCGAPWGSDASVLSRIAGIPCVVLGPDSAVEQAHTANESVSLEQVEQAARIFEATAVRFGERLPG
jgi:acetylornithine deacetylase